MAKPTKKLTTVSYTVLGLLRLRPHTPYELAGQVKRLAVFWTSAESVVYEEPKNLVAHGLAQATTEQNGKRSRTVYTITPAGERALSAWMSTPSGGPQIQFEAMLRVLFADAGTKAELLAAVDVIATWAAMTRANGEAISRDYLEDQAPYAGRTHIVALTMAYQMHFVRAVQDWAEWAARQIGGWDGTGTRPDVELEVFERVVRGEDPLGEPDG